MFHCNYARHLWRVQKLAASRLSGGANLGRRQTAAGVGAVGFDRLKSGFDGIVPLPVFVARASRPGSSIAAGLSGVVSAVGLAVAASKPRIPSTFSSTSRVPTCRL